MSKGKRTEQEVIADIRKELLGLEQQAMTAKQVEVSIWKLWGFVRDNQNSLDSEHCCKMIQEVINGAVESVTQRAEALAKELDNAQQELRDSKKEVKRLTKELGELMQENVGLKATISNLTDAGHPDAA